MSPSNTWLPVRMEAIPPALRAQPWIGWRARWEEAARKWRKEPFQIGVPSAHASNADAAHWRGEGDVREVLALAPDLFDGFGIVLTASAGLVFVDLDHVVDPETRAIAPWAVRMVETLDSWTEYSASGLGLHIFCQGRLPGSGLVGYLDGDPAQPIEVYDRARFAYLTGHVLEPARPLAARQALVTRLSQFVRPVGGLAGVAARSAAAASRAAAPILAGQRNTTLFRIARGFVLHGLAGTALEQALLAVSHRRCVPPLPDRDVMAIARHAVQLRDRIILTP
jgi:hypothetical protein